MSLLPTKGNLCSLGQATIGTQVSSNPTSGFKRDIPPHQTVHPFDHIGKYNSVLASNPQVNSNTALVVNGQSPSNATTLNREIYPHLTARVFDCFGEYCGGVHIYPAALEKSATFRPPAPGSVWIGRNVQWDLANVAPF